MTDLVTGIPGSIRCPELGGDPIEFDDPPTVTVVRDSSGEEVLDGASSTAESDHFAVTAPAIDLPDGLTATWTGQVDGHPAEVITRHEVVGGHIVGIPSIRTELERVAQNPLSTDEEIAEKRDLAEKRVEDACRVAFRPRYARSTVEANVHLDHLLLPRPRLLQVVSIDGEAFDAPASETGEIIGTDSWSGSYDVAWIHGYEAAPASVAAAVRQLAVHYLLVDPDDLDARATFKSNELASWSLVTPGVKGASFPLPEVNQVVSDFGYLRSVG